MCLQEPGRREVKVATLIFCGLSQMSLSAGPHLVHVNKVDISLKLFLQTLNFDIVNPILLTTIDRVIGLWQN